MRLDGKTALLTTYPYLPQLLGDIYVGRRTPGRHYLFARIFVWPVPDKLTYEVLICAAIGCECWYAVSRLSVGVVSMEFPPTLNGVST